MKTALSIIFDVYSTYPSHQIRGTVNFHHLYIYTDTDTCFSSNLLGYDTYVEVELMYIYIYIYMHASS